MTTETTIEHVAVGVHRSLLAVKGEEEETVELNWEMGEVDLAAGA